MKRSYCFVFLIVVCQQCVAVDWKDVITTIIEQAAYGNQVLRMNVQAKVKAIVDAEISKADIRLLKKDFRNKTPTSHPLLPKARIDQGEAISIFETNWNEYFQWSYDLDSEYKPIREAGQLFHSEHYNSTFSTLVILHDRCSSVKDPSVAKIVEALKLRNFDVHYNIFLLDFSKLLCHVVPTKGLFRLGFDPELRTLGNVLAKALHEGVEDKLLDPNQTHLLGLGVSTHLAGLVAKGLHSLSGMKVKSILGLDPPVRLIKRLVSRLHAEDIHIYHTYTRLPGIGPRLGMGTADFVFDGAKTRPICNLIKGKCSSSSFAGTQLFISTLLYPKLFPSRWCPSFKMFTNNFCDLNEFAYVSFPPQEIPPGTYQNLLEPQFPYGKGAEGIFMTNEPKEEDEAESEPSVEVTAMSDQEYAHYLEMKVAAMRTELVACMPKIPGPAMAQKAIQCVLNTQKHVKKLLSQKIIHKLSCDPTPASPTGKKCKYVTRTKIEFDLPY